MPPSTNIIHTASGSCIAPSTTHGSGRIDDICATRRYHSARRWAFRHHLTSKPARLSRPEHVQKIVPSTYMRRCVIPSCTSMSFPTSPDQQSPAPSVTAIWGGHRMRTIWYRGSSFCFSSGVDLPNEQDLRNEQLLRIELTVFGDSSSASAAVSCASISSMEASCAASCCCAFSSRVADGDGAGIVFFPMTS